MTNQEGHHVRLPGPTQDATSINSEDAFVLTVVEPAIGRSTGPRPTYWTRLAMIGEGFVPGLLIEHPPRITRKYRRRWCVVHVMA